VRNPLFGMGITLDALEAAVPDPEPLRELLAAIRGWLDRLNRLMENLLDYGKPWSADLQAGSVGGAIEEAVNGCRPIADAARISLRAQGTLLSSILMDENRLTRAFENLITNAIQHSPPGGSVIVDSKEDDGFVVCSVRDHGSGFADADLPRIFQPFYTKRRGGTGLGLSIVQRIVDEHGGMVRAENAAGGGAVVTIKLPVYQSVRS
jgi:signal transduction histidine kinase